MARNSTHYGQEFVCRYCQSKCRIRLSRIARQDWVCRSCEKQRKRASHDVQIIKPKIVCRYCQSKCRVRPTRIERWDWACKRCEKRQQDASHGVGLTVTSAPTSLAKGVLLIPSRSVSPWTQLRNNSSKQHQ